MRDKKIIYSGNWAQDKKKGIGTYVNFNGVKMRGKLVNNRIEGEALVEYPDGWKYLWKFKGGKKVFEKKLEGNESESSSVQDSADEKWKRDDAEDQE